MVSYSKKDSLMSHVYDCADVLSNYRKCLNITFRGGGGGDAFFTFLIEKRAEGGAYLKAGSE